MKILCDENVRTSIVTLLDQEGHDIERVQGSLDVGFEDAEIAEYCRTDGRVVLTNDDDFLTVDDPLGVLFLADQRTPPRDVAVALQRIERHVDPETLDDSVFHVPDGWI